MDHIEDLFPVMAKRRVSQVMAEGYGFGQIFVEIDSSGDGPCYLGDLDGMCHLVLK